MNSQKALLLKNSLLNSREEDRSLFESPIRGELRLLLALLENAIQDYWNGNRNQKIRANKWLRSSDQEIFSYLGICEFFELNANDTLHLILAGYFQDTACSVV